MMKKEEKKKQFRKHCLKRLAKVSPLKRYVKDKQILALLYKYISNNTIQSVMLYLPLHAEVNMYPLIKKLRKEQKQIYVPFMKGKSFKLVSYRLPLKKKQFGIKEPNDSRKYRQKNIDLAIVPIVGMDVTQRRVGFGKGMYDRFFEKNSKNIKEVIFVARELCYSKEIVTDHYDLKADKVITPR